MFSGEFQRTKKVALGGKSRTQEETREQVLERTRQEREQRRRAKLQKDSATRIQVGCPRPLLAFRPSHTYYLQSGLSPSPHPAAGGVAGVARCAAAPGGGAAALGAALRRRRAAGHPVRRCLRLGEGVTQCLSAKARA